MCILKDGFGILSKKNAEQTGQMLEKTKNYFYFFHFLLLLLYVVLFFGLFRVNLQYLHYLTVGVHIYICFFLIIRFNFFVKRDVLTEFDKFVIFSSSVLLLVNTLFSEIGLNKDYLKKMFHIEEKTNLHEKILYEKNFLLLNKNE